jgi:hypothetical protein
MPEYDFNDLEISADRHMVGGRHRDALAIYFYMADGDLSLDAGHLAERIASCYRALNELHAAKYWYGRALQENPEVHAVCADHIQALGNLDIGQLVQPRK